MSTDDFQGYLPPLPPELAVDVEPLDEVTLAQLDRALSWRVADADLPVDDLQIFAETFEGHVFHGVKGSGDLPPEAERWEITNDGAAEWTLRKVVGIDHELQRLAVQRDDWQQRIDQWFEQQTAPSIRRRSFFVGHLEQYAAARRDADPEHKTLALPSGRVTSKYQAARVKVLNDETVAAWLAEHGITVGPDGADLVVTTAKVYAVPLRNTLRPADGGLVAAETGEFYELPPGLVVEPGHVTYDVKPAL